MSLISNFSELISGFKMNHHKRLGPKSWEEEVTYMPSTSGYKVSSIALQSQHYPHHYSTSSFIFIYTSNALRGEILWISLAKFSEFVLRRTILVFLSLPVYISWPSSFVKELSTLLSLLLQLYLPIYLLIVMLLWRMY